MASNRNRAPGGAPKVVYALYAVCAALVVADFLYEKHGYLAIEDMPLFYALVGFAACAFLLVCATVLRRIVSRRDSYYAPGDVNAETYPEDQLDKVDADA